MQSFKKKVSTLLSEGLDGLSEGIDNFKYNIPEVEAKAKKRLQTCLTCPLFKPEPIPMFRVKDKRLPEASKMYCSGCGCTISYKIRQSVFKCEKWNE